MNETAHAESNFEIAAYLAEPAPNLIEAVI